MKLLSLYILSFLSLFSCSTWSMQNNKRTSSQAFAEQSARNMRQHIAQTYSGTPYRAYADALFSSDHDQENTHSYTPNSYGMPYSEEQQIYNSLVEEYDSSARSENNVSASITAPVQNDYRQTGSYDTAQIAAFEKTLEESIAHSTQTTRNISRIAPQEKDAIEIGTIYNRIAYKDRCEQLFLHLVKQTSLGLAMLEKVACYAKKELTASEIDSICNTIRANQSDSSDAQANADRMLSVLQPTNIDNKQNFKDLCEQRLTSTQVESLLNQRALTVPLIQKVIEQGNYCKNMWHILGNRYTARTLQVALRKGKSTLSEAAKKEIFDYLLANPIAINNDHGAATELTITILQCFFNSTSPQGYPPLHTLFPVEKLPMPAFEKLANTPANRSKLLAQGKEIFSRGSLPEIRSAIEAHIPCENALETLKQRSSTTMLGAYSDVTIARLKTYAKDCNYTLE